MPDNNVSRDPVEQIDFPQVSPVYRLKFLTRGSDMFEKKIIHNLFNLAKTGAFKVVYWDGTEEKFGIGIPSFKLIITQKSAISKIIRNPALSLGEAYIDGLIDLEGNIEDVFKLLYLNKEIVNKKIAGKGLQMVSSILRRPTINQQKKNIEHHYDLGNDFFALWLDPTMSYSCAYFKTAQDKLEQAQLHKIDHTLKKLQLKTGETLLDIGSGWGWLLIRAAQQYGVKATGITLSKEQHEKSKVRIRELGLSNLVDVQLMNYRELAASGQKFDKILSVGMFEHVGKAGISEYMGAVRDMLKPGGISLLHTITHTTEGAVNPWIKKYIFPGGYIPSLRETVWSLPEHDFHLLDVECLRMHYAMTLDRWAQNFEQKIDLVRKLYDDRFIRMWRLYLQSCAASFRYSGLSIHQLVFSKGLVNNLPLTREHISI